MTPYYRDKNFTLYCGDNTKVLESVKGETIDLVITSPPYDDLRDYKEYEPYCFHHLSIQLEKVLKDGGILAWNEWEQIQDMGFSMTSVRHLLYFVDELGLKNFERIFWNKIGASFSNQRRYFATVEWVWILSKGRPTCTNLLKDEKANNPRTKIHGTNRLKDGTISKRGWSGSIGEFKKRNTLWNINPANKEKGHKDYDHPAKFPEKLVEGLILSYSNEGDTVLDPFMGSGTTAVVAARNGRKCIGVEISEEYCELIVRRYKDSKKQGKLL